MTAIEFNKVDKFYGDYQALSGLSFQIEAGQIVGLLGPNGAGKSTTLKILLGLLSADQGEAHVLGQSVGACAIKNRVTCIPQELAFPQHLKVKEVIAMVARIYHIPVNHSLLEKYGVTEFENKLAGVLSGGQKRRLALALAFMPQPDIVIMDEPTTGLDVEAKALMWECLHEFRQRGGTLLITSHDLYELTQLADRLLLIDKGQLLFEGTAREMLGKCQFKKVSFRYADHLFNHDLVLRKEFRDGHWTCWTRHSDELVQDLVKKNHPFEQLHVESGDLHEIFSLLRGFQ